MAEVEPSDVVKLLEIKWAGKATAAKQSRRSIRDIMLIGLTPNATMDSVARWAGLTSPSL